MISTMQVRVKKMNIALLLVEQLDDWVVTCLSIGDLAPTILPELI